MAYYSALVDLVTMFTIDAGDRSSNTYVSSRSAYNVNVLIACHYSNLSRSKYCFIHSNRILNMCKCEITSK